MRTAQRSVDRATHPLISPQHEKTSREPPTTHPRINDEAFCACKTFFFLERPNIPSETRQSFTSKLKDVLFHAAPKIIPS